MPASVSHVGGSTGFSARSCSKSATSRAEKTKRAENQQPGVTTTAPPLQPRRPYRHTTRPPERTSRAPRRRRINSDGSADEVAEEEAERHRQRPADQDARRSLRA